MSINKLITKSVGCVKCGAPYGKCDCWTPCKCGWVYEKGTQCNNPIHKANRLNEIVGKWPGNETDEDIDQLLKDK